MNISKQPFLLLILFTLLAEIMEFHEAYKISRPYKYYHPKPWRRPRWHSYPRSQKFYRSKRIPPLDYYRPKYNRYAPSYDDTIDQTNDHPPYTIVIQLPRRNEGKKNYAYQRNYDRDTVFKDAYIDDDNDGNDDDVKMINAGQKKVRIKLAKGTNPQLHIKISRADDNNAIEIVPMEMPVTPEVSTNSEYFPNAYRLTCRFIESVEKQTTVCQ